MIYNKPELFALTSAVRAIQAKLDKHCDNNDSTTTLATNSAYEADE
jgi:hypothetical protein